MRRLLTYTKVVVRICYTSLDIHVVRVSLLFQALLTDMYQVTMAYAYWRAGRQDEHVRASANECVS